MSKGNSIDFIFTLKFTLFSSDVNESFRSLKWAGLGGTILNFMYHSQNETISYLKTTKKD